ncbi:MAG: 50S ribosomal protein L11 methyltransferase [Acidimicrobiia bacterium]|nr:50S ribosomal protein L11 methyltransferase [Acidimicrobiia bacterium]
MSERPDIDAVVLEVRSNQPDLAADRGWRAGALGIEERPDALLITFPHPDAAAEAWRSLAEIGHVTDVTESTRVDWVDRWRPHARATREPPFVVRPPWVTLERDTSLIDLAIDPGPTFGHGAHPTTRLLLRALPRYTRSTSRVLDVGCGSGVLAIGAARLGAARVHAIDIDPAAVAATADNAARNDVAVQTSSTPLADVDERFDLVLVNLTAAVLAELAPDLTRVATEHLLVSGVRAGQQVAGLESVTWTDEQDGWVGGVLRCGP